MRVAKLEITNCESQTPNLLEHSEPMELGPGNWKRDSEWGIYLNRIEIVINRANQSNLAGHRR